MDNILYGIKDPHYPYFKHLNGVVIPEQGSDDFITTAHQGANSAYSVDDADVCIDMSDELLCENGPKAGDQAWVVHLDTVDGKQPNDPSTVNTYRKLSALLHCLRDKSTFQFMNLHQVLILVILGWHIYAVSYTHLRAHETS